MNILKAPYQCLIGKIFVSCGLFINPMIRLLVFTVTLFAAQNVAAYVKITYNSGPIPWTSEEFTFVDGSKEATDLLATEVMSIEATFIVQDFQWATGEWQYLPFYNSLASVKPAGKFFDDFTIDPDDYLRLGISADGELREWSFYIGISEFNQPVLDGFAHAGFNSNGSGDAGYDYVAYSNTRWPVGTGSEIGSIAAEFLSGWGPGKLTIEKVTVSETHSIALILIGILFVAVLRQRHHKS